MELRTEQSISTVAYLTLVEDGPVAVEELKWSNDVTLNQGASHDRCRRPPSRAYGHFEKPLLQRDLTQLAITTTKQSRHPGPS